MLTVDDSEQRCLYRNTTLHIDAWYAEDLTAKVCGGSHCNRYQTIGQRSTEVSPKIIEVNFFVGFGLNFVESFLTKIS
jgi:hypothetical protein